MNHLADLSQEVSAWVTETSAMMDILPDLSLETLSPDTTALIIVDMVEGFTRQGALASARAAALIDPIASLTASCVRRNIPVLAFSDTHTSASPELQSYPPHCLRGTAESALCNEIAAAGGNAITVMEKNSTNGFVEPTFAVWQTAHDAITNWLIVGVCSDICVLQFTLTAKAWYNAQNRPLRLMVPITLTDTFDAPGHPAALQQGMALRTMQAGGIELFRKVTF